MEPPPPLKELSPANLKVLYSYGEVLSDKELGCLVEELVQEGSTMSRWASWWTTGHGGEVEGDVSQWGRFGDTGGGEMGIQTT